MKKFVHAVSLVLVSMAAGAVVNGCASGASPAEAETAARASDDGVVRGREVVLVVYGMSCPLCANNVDKELLEVPGVSAVTVDMSTGRATVTLDGRTPVTRRQLVRAVETSGFTLRGIEPH